MMKIKTIITLGLLGIILLFQSACDKVVYPNVISTTLDTTIFPGNFAEYEFPTFGENENTLRNVMIEDYTGHQCTGCPEAAATAKSISESNPERIFVASLHAAASNSGVAGFQETSPDYPIDFTNPQSTEMASTFFQASVGFFGNPSGTVNRFRSDGDFFFFSSSEWGPLVDSVLGSDLNVNIQAKSTYFPETNGVFLHTETEFVNNLEGTYNIIVYALENELVAPQKLFDGTRNPNYVHHDIHRGNLFQETWGRQVASDITVMGTKIKTDFSYSLPAGLTNEDMHFLVIIMNRETYQVEQVIRHEF